MITAFPSDQLDELEHHYGPVGQAEEAGFPYLRITALRLPAGASPERTDALLCPVLRDGYHSRLYLAEHVTCASASPNWAPTVHIVGSNWHVYSWQLNTLALRLAQMVQMHLKGLR